MKFTHIHKILICYFFCAVTSPLVSAQADNETWWRSFNLEAAGKYTEAAQTLEGLLKSDDAEFAEMRSGWLYYLSTDYSRSVKHYQNALKHNNESLEARLGMMLPLMAQARWREAAQQGNAVVATSKWNYYAHLRLLICEEALELWPDMIKRGEQIQRRYPADPSLLVYLARAYSNDGQSNKAKIAYEQVLHRMPGHVEATDFLAKY